MKCALAGGYHPSPTGRFRPRLRANATPSDGRGSNIPLTAAREPAADLLGRLIMTLCPVALAVGCIKCPVFKVCPGKGIIGDYKKAAPPPADLKKKQ